MFTIASTVALRRFSSSMMNLSVRPLSLLSCVAKGAQDTLSSTLGADDDDPATPTPPPLDLLRACGPKTAARTFVLPIEKLQDPSDPLTTSKSHWSLRSS